MLFAAGAALGGSCAGGYRLLGRVHIRHYFWDGVVLFFVLNEYHLHRAGGDQPLRRGRAGGIGAVFPVALFVPLERVGTFRHGAHFGHRDHGDEGVRVLAAEERLRLPETVVSVMR